VTRNNMLYLILGALVVAVVLLSYQLYQDRHQPEGLNINVGPGGLSIQGK
jgi:RsiW-degrading membrane proteinase PrsW (M82 family)